MIDADVLGRQRTGDETYVHEPAARAARRSATGLRFAAVTRRPELVPDGDRADRSCRRAVQELRMAVRCRCCCAGCGRRSRTSSHALPLGCRCPAVLTVHDLSFERDASLMGLARAARSSGSSCRARRAAPGRVLAVSERTKRDLVALYGDRRRRRSS